MKASVGEKMKASVGEKMKASVGEKNTIHRKGLRVQICSYNA